LTKQLSELMLQTASQSRSAATFIDQLQCELRRRFREPFQSKDAIERWHTFGIVQWLASDPQLARLVADELSEHFIVPWRPIAGHEWQGHLAVLSFEVPDGPDKHNALRSSWNRLAAELRRRDRTSQPVIGSAAQPIMAELNPDTDVLWVRWPQLLSLAFLWLESNPLGQRFAEDAELEALRRKAREWDASQEERSWIAFSEQPGPRESADDPQDAARFEEV